MSELAEWLRGVLAAIEGECLDPQSAARVLHPDYADAAVQAVLARIETERAILEIHRGIPGRKWPARKRPDGGYVVDPDPDNPYCDQCSDDDPRAYACPWPCDTLLWLAYGHRHDAPGYRAEWVPEGMGAR